MGRGVGERESHGGICTLPPHLTFLGHPLHQPDDGLPTPRSPSLHPGQQIQPASAIHGTASKMAMLLHERRALSANVPFSSPTPPPHGLIIKNICNRHLIHIYFQSNTVEPAINFPCYFFTSQNHLHETVQESTLEAFSPTQGPCAPVVGRA